jgi:hypothetical protein
MGDCPAEGEWFGILLKPGAFLSGIGVTRSLCSFVSYLRQREKAIAYYLMLTVMAIISRNIQDIMPFIDAWARGVPSCSQSLLTI